MALKTEAALGILTAGLLFGLQADPTLAQGVLLQSGDAAGAVNVLKAVTSREPGNGRAWRNLGVAYQQAKDPDGAIAAFQRALEVQPEMAAPLYNIALIYAAKQDADHAFEWLGKAKATRKIDMSQAEAAPELAPFRSDPRFAAILPKASDFANPFVEPVKIIREWAGEGSNDQFGWIARSIGDVDHDGVPDFVTSAPTKNLGGQNAGRVYVYSTRTGKLIWSVDGKPGDQLGIGIEAAGDVNRDGIPDVVASAPGAGKAYIYSGKDGRVLVTMTAEDAADKFGRHVAGAGDVNGDGYADVIIVAGDVDGDGRPDLIVGAWQFSGEANSGGRTYLYSGRTGGLLKVFTCRIPGDTFGFDAVGMGDIDGDGTVDLLITSAWSGIHGFHSGRVFLISSGIAKNAAPKE